MFTKAVEDAIANRTQGLISADELYEAHFERAMTWTVEEIERLLSFHDGLCKKIVNTGLPAKSEWITAMLIADEAMRDVKAIKSNRHKQ